jgi:hypothetical protein
LIKVTPEDGIKANQKIGEFIKKLKVWFYLKNI